MPTSDFNQSTVSFWFCYFSLSDKSGYRYWALMNLYGAGVCQKKRLYEVKKEAKSETNVFVLALSF
jgi:hypothetical protein